MTASLDALEHGSGFLHAFSPTRQADRDGVFSAGVDRPLRILEQGLNIKRYPVCYGAHRAIDGVLALDPRGDLVGQVDSIEVEIGEVQMAMLRNHKPRSALEAKFSLEFSVASALIFHHVGLAQLKDEIVQRPDLQTLMQRVRYTTTKALGTGLPFSPADTVVIHTQDGRRLVGEPVASAKGSHANPLSQDELAAKFRDCMASKRPGPEADALFMRLMALECVGSVAELWR